MKRIGKAGKWLNVWALTVVTLAACAEKVPDYSGEYEMLLGNNCLLMGEETVFLELALAGERDERSYVARIPIAANMGLPIMSTPGAFNASNELTVFFSESSKGAMGVTAGKSMAVTLTPHPTRPEHLLIIRWGGEGHASGYGSMSTDVSVLDTLLTKLNQGTREQFPSYVADADLSNTTMCLGNIARLSPEERTDLVKTIEAGNDALVTDEVTRLAALPFGRFWGIGEECKGTPLTPTCQAYGQLAEDRIAQERIDAEIRLQAMSESDLKRVEQECQNFRLPQCDAYTALMKEREAVNTQKLREQMIAMEYALFSSQENKYCANSWNPDCDLYRSLEEQKRADEIARLVAKHTGQELLDFEWRACNSASPGYVRNDELCKFNRVVTQAKRSLQVAHYSNNPAELRELHNACFDEYKALRGARKNQEANALKKTFRCMTALDGARAAGHRGQLVSRME
tara:strand:+ start:52034 stop:53407 length:1374 start_codon:yes stop_codon:yes gene_type:complete